MTLRSRGTLLDLAIVAFAVFTLWRVGGGLFATDDEHALPPTAAIPPPLLVTGSSLILPGVEWNKAERHVVVRLLTTCPACNSNKGFYSELSRRIREVHRDIRLIVVTSEDSAVVRPWFESANILYDQNVMIERPSESGFVVVPTVLFVDKTGVVSDVFVGRVDSEAETLLLARLSNAEATSLDNGNFAEEIRPEDVVPTVARLGARIVDLSERSHDTKAVRPVVSIPVDELRTRAASELTKSVPVVMLCGNVNWLRCRTAGREMKLLGYESVTLAAHAVW
jgi:hypothetical protein